MDRMGRFSGWAGVGFVLLLVASWFTAPSGFEAVEQSGESIALDFSARADMFALRTALLFVSTFLGFWFVGDVHTRMRGLRSVASTALIAGGVMIGILIVEMGLETAAYALPSLEADPDVAKTLFLIEWSFSGAIVPAMAAFMSAVIVASLRSDVFPSWLGWTGIGAMAILAVNVALQTASLAIVAFIWVLALALTMLRLSIEPSVH
jgi:hypothetical protein